DVHMGPKGVKPKRSAFRKIGHAVNVVRSALHEQRKRSSRSPKWRTVEKAQLVAHPTCAACGGTIRLNVHHIKPYHLFPELELEPTNLITLCMGPMECHLRLGHGGLFRAYVVD